ncbi:glycosyltransferase [Pseudomonas fulva]|uniref:glycosyltransferase n=1 Tax=Pseudomonas fulva TaxID=47880 RepID=UPI002DB84A98|nr:glycosyltransferase [Pseudomonas fulva]MEB8057678.1 putative rhamnosyl transferase [Pseudomonas fulva]
MEKHVVVTIRYSLYAPELRDSWVIGQTTEEDYLTKLLSAERLEKREKIFDAITLKSLVGLYASKPAGVEFKVYILTTSLLPEKNLSYLRAVEEKYKFIEVCPLEPDTANLNAGLEEYVERLNENDVFASVRLDDDDGLAKTFLHQLNRYLNAEFSGFVISFAKGHGVLLNGAGDFVKMANYKWRFGSAGLTYISTKTESITTGRHSIYQCGNHIKTDDEFATISDGRHAAFIRAFHSGNDSEDKFETCVGRVLSDEEAMRKCDVYNMN